MTTVAEVMTAAPDTVTAETSIRDAAFRLRGRGRSLLPVVEGGGSLRLVGVITDRDIVERCLAAEHEGGCRVGDHMTATRLVVARTGEEIGVVGARMELARVHTLPVLDDADQVVGIVGRVDLIARVAPPLR